MKKRSLLSLVLALALTAGAFASCKAPETDTETDSSSVTTEENTNQETDTDIQSTKESTSVNDTETETKTDTETDTDTVGEQTNEKPKVSIENTVDNGLLIENAYALANGVNAYFTDGKRTDFALTNQNMYLEYALANYKDQQITALKNSSGAVYIENTADVFVKMKTGVTFYASDSTKHATANLYRFGYYMYEARFEEQIFSGDIQIEDSFALDLKAISKNQAKPGYNDDGSLHLEVTGSDPFITFKGVNYPADEYKFIQVTMKANAIKPSAIVMYVKAGSKTGFTEDQAKYINFYNDGEYHTYTFALADLKDYTGKVTGIRFDVAGEKGSTFDITEVKVVKGNDGGVPSKLGLNRSFFVYSDKMHHYLQIATENVATTGIESIGMETKIAADTVAKLIVKDKNGTHSDLKDVDWQSAEYVGFDIKGAGIFGYILPADNSGGTLSVTLADGYYTVIQSATPKDGTILPSGKYNAEKKRIIADVPLNGNDFYMGQRIYTDKTHDFETFLREAELERHPLTAENFVVDTENSTMGSFVGYDALRGIYTFNVDSAGFNGPYYRYPNKHYNLKFTVKGDANDRNLYIMAASTSGCLECAALLDENNMMLPIPIEVGKNFSESTGERNLWNIDDKPYGEAIIPMVIKAGSEDSYNFLNLYQNWGQHPLKQVSWIQFYAPYYHLSTGVTETNCIVPYYSCKNARGLNTLPDHRSMSAPEWSDQPQHNSCGSHHWLIYTDANGVYSASENTLNTIDSFGPTYADVTSHYISDDGNVKVTYTHTEFPQTDENRTYYEMHYEILGDVSFKDFSRDFHFYKVTDNDPTGIYQSVGYLNEKNECVIVNAAEDGESNKYVLGDKSPYFSFFNMKNCTSTSQQGYSNVSFLVYNSEFTIGGQKIAPSFAIVNEKNSVRISLDLGEITLKKGDTFTINAIVLPWGSQESVYDSKDFAGDQNVRNVREDSLLNPLTPKAVADCTVMESVYVPKLRSTNGKSATFTLTGGNNNVAVRVYGFDMLTVPYVEELVNGEWVEYKLSSAYTPDVQGNAHYYDGYCVYYDQDGTFSYSFVTTMDKNDKDGRTFRISADKKFEGWSDELPVVMPEEEDLPLNVYMNAEKLYNEAMLGSGPQFNGITLSDDKSYVTFESKGATESYFQAYPGGTSATGQYLVVKYRLPSTNTSKVTVFEIFVSTKNNSPQGEDCFSFGTALINDGQWHTVVVDLASWEKPSYAPSDNGTYQAKFIRLDPFYKNPVGTAFEYAFLGISDNVEDIYALVTDMDAIQYVTKEGSKIVVTHIDPENGEKVDPPAVEPETEKEAGSETESKPSDSPVVEDAKSDKEGFNVYIGADKFLSASSKYDRCHAGGDEMIEDGTALRIYSCNDESKSEQYRKESYFYLFQDGTLATGQYLIIKYRAPAEAKQLQIYTSTQNAKASDGGSSMTLKNENGLFICDNEWHIAVIDLSKALRTYTADSNGKFVSKHLRVDLFNFGKPLEDGAKTYTDIGYVGLCDDYTEILGTDTSVSSIQFFDGSSTTATNIPNTK